MKKGKVIIGVTGSGKTKLAEELSKCFLPSQVTWFNARRKNFFDDPYIFSSCSEDTKLIIVDDLVNAEDIEFFFPAITSGIEVKKRGKVAFRINPEIIIICDQRTTRKTLPEGASVTARFDFIECLK